MKHSTSEALCSPQNDRFPCLGRALELSQVLSCYEKACYGESTFIQISGKHGIGKSTFIAEIRQELKTKGSLVIEIKCHSGQNSFKPLLILIRKLIAELCEWKGINCASEYNDLLEHFQNQSSMVSKSTHSAWSLDPSMMILRSIVFDKLATLLSTVSAFMPISIIFHDIEHADPATLDGVKYLALQLTPHSEIKTRPFSGLIIACSPSSSMFQDEPTWSATVNELHINLTGLDRDGVRAFLSSEKVIDTIMKSTGGLPHLLKRITHFEDIYLPSPKSFTSSEIELLHLLAVLGRAASIETLRLISGFSGDQLIRTLGTLAGKQTLEKMIVDGEILYDFSCSGDGRLFYDHLSCEERQDLHEKIGLYFESRGERELESCAIHYLKGHSSRKAVKYVLEIGQKLEIALCFERAAALYEQALLQTDSKTRLMIEERLWTLYTIMNQFDRALALLENRKNRYPDDSQMTSHIAHLHLIRGETHLAKPMLLSLLETAREQNNINLMARTLADLAEASLLSGQNAEALQSVQEGLCILNEKPNETDLFTIELDLKHTLTKLYLDQNDLKSAQATLEENVKLSSRIHSVLHELRNLIQLGLCHLRQGEYERANEKYNQATHLAKQTGELRYQAVALQHLAVLSERQGRYGDARRLYQEAIEVYKKLGHAGYLGLLALDMGSLYLKMGDGALAEAMLHLAERLTRPHPQMLASQILIQILYGQIAHFGGKIEEALEHVYKARDIALKGNHQELLEWSLLELASIYLDLNKPDQTLSLIRNELGSLHSERLCLKGALFLGRAELQLGHNQVAKEQLQGILQNHATEPEIMWQTYYYLGLLERDHGRGTEAQAYFTSALKIEEEIRQNAPEEFRSKMQELPLRQALKKATEEVSPMSQAKISMIPIRELNSHIQSFKFGSLLGAHKRMQRLYSQIEKVASSDATVLVLGESGTGKELICETIHAMSSRLNKPLIKVSCAALVENLLLSELFGHERGAFTGALQRKQGRFELAHGGTLFLDEIGDISLKTQVALLRVLQEREFERVGGVTPIRVDVRIIFATNRDLHQMVKSGAFREDLYYRLHGVRLDVPPLRDRMSDIALLANYFLKDAAHERNEKPKIIDAEALQLLEQYTWPGNVRQLENMLRSVSLFAEHEVLTISDFSEYSDLFPIPKQNDISEPIPTPRSYAHVRSLGLSLKDYKQHIEIECITAALSEVKGNITRAAELLGMKRPRLSQLIKEYNISIALKE